MFHNNLMAKMKIKQKKFCRPGGKSSIDADAIGIRAHISGHKESQTASNGNEEKETTNKKSITQQLNEHRWGQFDR